VYLSGKPNDFPVGEPDGHLNWHFKIVLSAAFNTEPVSFSS
jgi:hypothetical protein